MKSRASHRLTRALVAVTAVATAALVVVTIAHTNTGNSTSRGIDVPVAKSTPDPEEQDPTALWIGDSYTAGVGSDAMMHSGYPNLVCNQMGWTCAIDAQPGTGFLNPSETDGQRTLGDRLKATHRRFFADVIIVDAGRNDNAYPDQAFAKAADKFFKRLKHTYPHARIIAIAPWIMTQPYVNSVNGIILEVGRRNGIPLLDPFSEGWTVTPQTPGWMTQGSHFVQEGQEWVADHLAADMKRLGLDKVPVTDTVATRAAARR